PPCFLRRAHDSGPPPFPTRRSSDLTESDEQGSGHQVGGRARIAGVAVRAQPGVEVGERFLAVVSFRPAAVEDGCRPPGGFRRLGDRKSTRLNSSHGSISYAVFCLNK